MGEEGDKSFRMQSSLPGWKLEDPWLLFPPAPLRWVMAVGGVGPQEGIWQLRWNKGTVSSFSSALIRCPYSDSLSHSVVCTQVTEENLSSFPYFGSLWFLPSTRLSKCWNRRPTLEGLMPLQFSPASMWTLTLPDRSACHWFQMDSLRTVLGARSAEGCLMESVRGVWGAACDVLVGRWGPGSAVPGSSAFRSFSWKCLTGY